MQEKYQQPIYQIGVSSLNFNNDCIWLQHKEGNLINPYDTLPKLFTDWTDEEVENNIGNIDNIADGGVALTAYGKLQYTNMSEKERNELKNALLKYCELDTLAMVMIYEHFREITV